MTSKEIAILPGPGIMKKKVLFIGNSNVRAVHDAFSGMQDDFIEPAILWIRHDSDEFKPFVSSQKGKPSLNKNIVTFIRNAGPDLIVSLIGGTDHNVFGLIEFPEKFDFVDPSLGKAAMCRDGECRQLIPYHLIKNIFRKRLKIYSDFFSKLTEFDRPVFHLESPPPKNNEYITRYPGPFKEKLHLGIAPVELRFKLWRLYSRVKSELCREAGVTFIPVPDSVHEDMLLLDKYCFADSTHANEEFGKVLIEVVKKKMRETGNE